MTRWSAINHPTRRSCSALAYGSRSTAAAEKPQPAHTPRAGTLLRHPVDTTSRDVVDPGRRQQITRAWHPPATMPTSARRRKARQQLSTNMLQTRHLPSSRRRTQRRRHPPDGPYRACPPAPPPTDSHPDTARSDTSHGQSPGHGPRRHVPRTVAGTRPAGTWQPPEVPELRLTRAEARRIAVGAQLLGARRPTELVELVTHLTFLQVDPTAAIAPAADLVAWSRLGSAYRPEHLRQALEHDRTLFEHDALVRPMSDVALVL